jgi:hypothetical protein
MVIKGFNMFPSTETKGYSASQPMTKNQERRSWPGIPMVSPA